MRCDSCRRFTWSKRPDVGLAVGVEDFPIGKQNPCCLWVFDDEDTGLRSKSLLVCCLELADPVGAVAVAHHGLRDRRLGLVPN